MAAVVEPQPEHRVALLEHRVVRGHVGRRARVRLDVRMLGAEQRLRPLDREPLDLVDDLAAAVVATPGRPSAYLFVSTEPTASSTDGQVKFSDAISSSWSRWRRSSALQSSAISGSISARPAVRRSLSVRSVMLTVTPMRAARTSDVRSLRGARGSRPRTARPRAAPRASRPVRSTTVEGLPIGVGPPSIATATFERIASGTSSRDARIRLARQVRRRCGDRTDPVDRPGDRRRQHRHAQADPRGVGPAQPAEPPAGVRHDDGHGTRAAAARARTPARPSSSGRTVVNTVSSEAGDDARRLRQVAPLDAQRPLARVRQMRGAREPVHRVGRQDRRPAGRERRDERVEIVLERQAQWRHSARKRARPSAMPRAIRWRTPGCSSRAASAGFRMLAVSSSTFGTCDQSRPP